MILLGNSGVSACITEDSKALLQAELLLVCTYVLLTYETCAEVCFKPECFHGP